MRKGVAAVHGADPRLRAVSPAGCGEATASSLILIGDELLSGQVRDVQTTWLASRLAAHGAPVERVQMIPDCVADIADAVRREVERGGGRILVTVGGLGPTPDDLTYAGVARALRVPLVHSRTVARFVRRWANQDARDDEGLAAMMRMALVPEGSRVLDGDGPVAVADVGGGASAGGTTIVMLPGVPEHARAVFDPLVVRVLLTHCAEPDRASIDIFHDLPESALASCFRLVERAGDQYQLGSYCGTPMVLRLSGPAAGVRSVEGRLRQHLNELGSRGPTVAPPPVGTVRSITAAHT